MRDSKAWTVVRIGLATQLLLAVAAFVTKHLGDCGSCGTSGAWLALAGAAGYAVLLACAEFRGPSWFLFVAIFAAFVVHSRLALATAASDAWCVPCALAAITSGALFIAALACDRANLKRAALVLPAGAMLLAGGEALAIAARGATLRSEARASVAHAPPSSALVQLIVFEDSNCPHCQTLERDVLPIIEREYSDHLAVVRRSAVGLPGLALPTLIVAGRDGEEVIEGLPTVEMLRAAIERVAARVPALPSEAFPGKSVPARTAKEGPKSSVPTRKGARP